MSNIKSPLYIAICDDQAHDSDEIEKYIRCFLDREKVYYQIKSYHHPMEMLNEAEEFDILFLDIEMPEMDGLAVAKKMLEQQIKSKIIFISSHREYVQEGYKVKAFRFLYKPVQSEDIREVLNDILAEIRDLAGITILYNKQRTWLLFKDILMIQSLGDESLFQCTNKSFITYQSLKKIKEQLDSRFFQCHRSYIINLEKIDEIQYNKEQLILTGGLCVPIAIRSKAKLKKAYHLFTIERARYM